LISAAISSGSVSASYSGSSSSFGGGSSGGGGSSSSFGGGGGGGSSGGSGSFYYPSGSGGSTGAVAPSTGTGSVVTGTSTGMAGYTHTVYLVQRPKQCITANQCFNSCAYGYEWGQIDSEGCRLCLCLPKPSTYVYSKLLTTHSAGQSLASLLTFIDS